LKLQNAYKELPTPITLAMILHIIFNVVIIALLSIAIIVVIIVYISVYEMTSANILVAGFSSLIII
jgi:hypothetical protein